MQMKHIFHGLILWFPSLTVVGDDIKCNHVEEKTAVQLHFVWSPNDNARAKVMISLNEAEMALCYLEPTKCKAFSKLTKATIKSTPTQRYEITVSVLGVKSSGYWKVQYINEADAKNDRVCKFIMFARAKDLKCQSLSTEEIHIYCFSKRIYPSAACYLNYTGSKENYISEGRQLHSQDTLRHETHHLTSTCTFVKPASIATTDTFTAVVTMFPNISGSLNNIMYGTSVSVLVTLSKPFIKFENCPEEVDLGAAVDCLCSVEGLEPVNAMFRWYNTDTNAVISNKSRLTFVATEQSKEFSCVFEDVLNKRNLSLTYVLHVNNSQNFHTSISTINSSYK
uniref:Ig-like domain-containing protein n=1 Tax=Biomphalaria glabrata TaxID=6526 RepID=A0A2C9LJP8_BIOGL